MTVIQSLAQERFIKPSCTPSIILLVILSQRGTNKQFPFRQSRQLMASQPAKSRSSGIMIVKQIENINQSIKTI